jgi:hypothetical protein
MRILIAGVVIIATLFTAQAQDGIYGTFNVGQKITPMDALNDALHEIGYEFEDFINNYWTFGGEGHIILAKHFVVGGKGYALGLEREIIGTTPLQTIKVVGGLGLGTLGYAFCAGKEKQIRLIPQLGLGVSSFLLQNKVEYTGNEDMFNNAIRDDHRSVLSKVGFAVDLGIGFDWYLKLIELVKIIPGLGFGPLFHADIGYTLVPVNSEWVRDFDDAGSDMEPDLSLKGFYVSLGLGFGLSSSK